MNKGKTKLLVSPTLLTAGLGFFKVTEESILREFLLICFGLLVKSGFDDFIAAFAASVVMNNQKWGD